MTLPRLSLFVLALGFLFVAGCTAPDNAAIAAQKQEILARFHDSALEKQMADVAHERMSHTPGLSVHPRGAPGHPPVLRHRVEPLYPFALRRAGVQGLVWVGFIVDPTGHVSRVEALTDNSPALNAAATAAVRQWVFQPGVVDGKTVSTLLVVPIAFTLD